MENPQKGKAVGYTLDADGKKVPVFAAADPSAATTKPAAGDGAEWQCTKCKEMMGPSAAKYCGNCADDGDDEDDENEEEAKALGLDPKASLGARRARAQALVQLEAQLYALTSSPDAAIASHEKALEAVKSGQAAKAENAKVVADGKKATLRATLERGLAGAPGKPPTLSLGQIQKHMTVSLRGPAKKSWAAAMDKVAADADTAKTTVSAAQIIDAACSVELSAEDLESVQDYVANSPPVAASTHSEPQRNGETESDELDPDAQRIAKKANQVRAQLDRNNPTAAK